MMKNLPGMFTIILAASILFSQSCVHADENPDAMFKEAQNLAAGGKRKEASEKCEKILSLCPDCVDARILLGRIHSWDKDYAGARVELEKALKAKPDYEDAVEALIDVELWSGDAAKALFICDEALKTKPGNADLLYKRALSLESLGRADEAKTAAADALKADASNQNAVKLLARLNKKAPLYSASMAYSLDAFDSTFSPWSNLSFSFSRKFPYGSVIFSVNGARRFDKETVQLELEAYPKITKKTYLWIDGGASNGSLFPTSRLGLEVYTAPSKTYEASAGMRHLNFSANNANIYTASIGKYMGRWYVSARPYYSRKNGNNSYSGNVNIKRYFKDGVNYFGVTLGSGSTPSESIFAFDTARLDSNSLGLEWQRGVGPASFLKLNFGYGEEEYARGTARRKRYSFGVSLKTSY